MANNRAALYSRVSTPQQVERGESIPFQKAKLEERAKKLGYTFVHYSDEALSGGSTQRAEYLRMLADVEAGKINAAIFYDLSRVSRDMYDALLLQKTLDEHKVEIISVSDNIDFKTDEGDFMFKIKGIVNERYRKDLIKRLRATMWNKAEKGDFCGGPIPFGYNISENKKDKTPAINGQEAELVKEMYNRYEDSPSFRDLTLWLNESGFRTKRGKTWATSTVRRILTNLNYKGYYTYGKRANGSTKHLPDYKIFKGRLPPIISEEQFDRIQIIVKERAFLPPRRKTPRTIYILSGIMKCECGGSLNGYTQVKPKTGKAYRYYKCHNNTSKSRIICKGNTLRKEEIEAKVILDIKEKATIQFEDQEVKDYLNRQSSASSDEQMSNIRRNLAEIRKRKKNLFEAVELKGCAGQEIAERLKELKDQEDTATDQLDKLKIESSPKEKDKRTELLRRVRDLNGHLKSLSEEAKKTILRQLVRQITVKRSGDIDLELYEI
ncbi:MAG: recombinase family protein [Dehalococcoidales bacterium]|jgi:site-specific DNA recombinase